MKNFIEFEMDALEFGVADAEEGDVVLITIDTDDKKARIIWYNPNHPDYYWRNPANHISEDLNYNEALQLYEQYKVKGEMLNE